MLLLLLLLLRCLMVMKDDTNKGEHNADDEDGRSVDLKKISSLLNVTINGEKAYPGLNKS
jgi:hypothetical protein